MIKKILFLVSVLSFTSFANAIYIGGSGGYLTDMEVAYETGRFGMTLVQLEKTRHNLELELGHGYEDSGYATVRMIPLTLNYRGETDLTKTLFAYYGAGIGSAHIKVELAGYSGSGSSFVYQAFGGAGYRVSDSVSVLAGVRYLNMSSIEIDGCDVGSDSDIGVNIGIQFSF
jgi:opacity protein-like surface antigen